MLKIEIIWRELLFEALEKRKRRFTQKELAEKFGFSTSTIFQALKIPRKMGAVRVTGRFFTLDDPEKLLYHWASVRTPQKDLIYQTRVDLPVLEIEGQMPPGTIFGVFSAFRQKFQVAPADYDRVYVYTQNAEEIKKRLPPQKGTVNLFVLAADQFLPHYGPVTPLGQTFTDLWNLKEWYAKEFVIALKEKINGLL